MNKDPLHVMDRYAVLLDAPEPAFARLVERRERRRRRRRVAAGAGATTTLAGFVAAMVWVLPIGSDPSPDRSRSISAAEAEAVASPVGVATAAASTEPAVEEPAPQPPVEFTACNGGLDQTGVIEGQHEEVTIPVSGGEITLNRDRGIIVPQFMSEISEPRLDGTWTLAWNEDDYTGAQVANVVTVILRIENEEGAWQGADTVVRPPGEEFDNHFVLAGEGAYKGLTAAMAWYDTMTCPNIKGYILELGVPEAEGTFPDP